jgi:hypothetical protein
MPQWLPTVVGIDYLWLATAAVIAIDVTDHPRRMTVMNIVWPFTALYFPVAGMDRSQAHDRSWRNLRLQPKFRFLASRPLVAPILKRRLGSSTEALLVSCGPPTTKSSSATRCTHVARRRWRCGPSDDEVVNLGLSCNCSTDCIDKWSIRL